ncbi:MAG: hypothetical protein ACM3O3_13125 [Syntrophothermus sp.]
MKGGLKQEFEAYIVEIGKEIKKYYNDEISINEIFCNDIRHAKLFKSKELAEKCINEVINFYDSQKNNYTIKKIKVEIQELSMLT